jgi:hypothetical protein
VREDTQRKGLLFASTERTVYVSFDDGDHWQSLRLNLPATSVRDVIVKGDDLAIGTHGRGFWILDDITALRQVAPSVLDEAAFLFKPQTAVRVRWSMQSDTPLPPDTPTGENPPDGAVIDYYLKAKPAGPVTLEIKDAAGKTVRRYSSTDPVPAPDPKLRIPPYWLRPPQVLSAEPGMHRFLWDLHYPPMAGEPEYPISAVPHNTAPDATSPWALPGQYTVVLTADGKSYSRPLTVKMDPRVKTGALDLAQQFRLSYQTYQDLQGLAPVLEAIASVRAQLKDRRQHVGDGSAIALSIEALEKKLEPIAGGGPPPRPGVPATTPVTLESVNGRLGAVFGALQEADLGPTATAVASANELHAAIPGLLARWHELTAQDLAALNAQLRGASRPEVKPEAKP